MNSELVSVQPRRRMILNKKQKIVQSGRSSHLPLGKELNKLVGVGDELEFSSYIENGKLIIQGIKELCKFSFEEIKTLAIQNNFKIIDDKTIGDVMVFQAVKDSMVISCTQDLNSHKVSVTISNTKPITDYSQYENLKQKIRGFDPNAIIQPAGDLDTINILEDPSQYNLDFKKAFLLLKKADKKIAISVLIKFDNEDHTLKSIKQTLNKLAVNL